MKREIPLHKRIAFIIPAIVIIVLAIGLGVMSFYFSQAQIDLMYRTHETMVNDEAELLFRSIKATMLVGEARTSVALMKDLESSASSSYINVFDINGQAAFSTNNTIEKVNDYLQEERFPPKKTLIDAMVPFNKSIFSDTVENIKENFAYVDERDKISVDIYKPLINQPKCNTCHGVDHVVRGVIYISHPLNDVQRMSVKTMHVTWFMFIVMEIVLTTVIIIFLRRLIFIRIKRIGSVVEQIGQGNLEQTITIARHDEIGRLSSEVNKMIDGLRERFKLSKFVSRATLDLVESEEAIQLGGKKAVVTVLFSDIRGFTHYSEFRKPEEVLTALNRLMNLQVESISKYGGDIDKFVGDEIMAIYTGKDMTLRAVKTALEIKQKIRGFDRGDGQFFYVGIGINTGEVILGNMGSAQRIDRTVIGDTVNLGARLCSIAGKNTIVVSSSVYEKVKDKAVCEEQEPFMVKGKKRLITAYILKGLKDEKSFN